jgi:hypothetical protein
VDENHCCFADANLDADGKCKLFRPVEPHKAFSEGIPEGLNDIEYFIREQISHLEKKK